MVEVSVQPVIALVAIFSKSNEPILLRNYLSDYLKQESWQKMQAAKANLAGADDHILKVQKARDIEMENINMQMSMLAYATLDVFSEKQYCTPDHVVYIQKKKDEKAG